MKNKGALGEFFKDNLASGTAKLDTIALEILMKDLGKSNFLAFSLRNFNVYYAAAIFSGFMLSMFLGAHYLKNHETLEENLNKSRNEIVVLNQEINSLKTSLKNLSETDENTIIQTKSVDKKANLKHPENEKSPIINTLKLKLNKTTIDSKGIVLSDSTKTQSPKKITEQKVDLTTNIPISKKVSDSIDPVYIHVRDTIFEFDTLKVRKKR